MFLLLLLLLKMLMIVDMCATSSACQPCQGRGDDGRVRVGDHEGGGPVSGVRGPGEDMPQPQFIRVVISVSS
jgi:hypothetical protein